MELPYLNRARLAAVMKRFVVNGVVMSVQEANNSECLLPWGGYHQVWRL